LHLGAIAPKINSGRNTQVTHSDHIENEASIVRRPFHWRVQPDIAAKIAVYAKRNGMHIGAAVEKAIELLTTSPSTNNRRGTL
jgi:hypothetical protein